MSVGPIPAQGQGAGMREEHIEVSPSIHQLPNDNCNKPLTTQRIEVINKALHKNPQAFTWQYLNT